MNQKSQTIFCEPSALALLSLPVSVLIRAEIQSRLSLPVSGALESVTMVTAIEPTNEQLNTLERLLIHLHTAYHHGGHQTFGAYAEECDRLKLPFWTQNNVSAIADEKPLLYRHSARHLALCACTPDWRTTGLRRD